MSSKEPCISAKAACLRKNRKHAALCAPAPQVCRVWEYTCFEYVGCENLHILCLQGVRIGRWVAAFYCSQPLRCVGCQKMHTSLCIPLYPSALFCRMWECSYFLCIKGVRIHICLEYVGFQNTHMSLCILLQAVPLLWSAWEDSYVYHGCETTCMSRVSRVCEYNYVWCM